MKNAYRSWRWKKRERKRLRCRSMGLASARMTRARCATQEIDADTARDRDRWDARGQVIRQGATYRATGITHWCVRRSLAGAVDQFDFVANGRVRLTAGSRKFPRHFRP